MIMSPPATFRLLGERSSVASPGIGHFYFAQRGHYHFAGTKKNKAADNGKDGIPRSPTKSLLRVPLNGLKIFV
jgi:hypothetical protein